MAAFAARKRRAWCRVTAACGALVAVLGSCTDDEPPPDAPLAELCGEPGPFRLLALSPEHRPLPGESIVRVDDRIALIVGTDRDKVGFERSSVYAVGPCGEDPAVIGSDIDRLFTVPQWPDVVLGCEHRTGDLLRLDPTGATPPVWLAEAPCDTNLATWGPAGLVHVLRTDPMQVIFHPYASTTELRFGDPIVLLDDVPYPDHAGEYPRPLIDGTLVLFADGELVHVGLDGSVRSEQIDVRYYELSPDARYLIWQERESEDAGGEFPAGDIFVRDRDTGATTFVTHAYLPAQNGNEMFPAPDTAQVTLGPTLAGQWVIDLPTFSLYQVPQGQQLNQRSPDGRWLARSALFGPYLLRDLASGAVAPVTDRKGYPFAVTEHHLDLLTSQGFLERFSTTRLLRFSYAGGEPRVLATRATRDAYYLDAGRLITPVAISASAIGSLLLVDTDTREELLIDAQVAGDLDHDRWHRAFAADIVAYGVVDGERSGIWLARPR